MKGRTVIIISTSVLLLFSCFSKTRMITIKSDLNISRGKNFSVSHIIIKAPKKGQNVFTFEDISTFTEPGVHTSAGGVETHIPGGRVTINRGSFEYYLSEDSDSNFLEALYSIFRIEEMSPYSIECKADFKYYIATRGSMSNMLGIYMLLNVLISRDEISIFENNYKITEEEKYSSAWITLPKSSTMNKLYNKALNKIVDQVSSDDRIADALKK